MGLLTDYLGHLRIAPVLSAQEVEFLQAFNRTRHCGDDDAPLRVAQHPSDNEPTGGESYNRPAPGMPELWCPWTCCDDGCCLQWDGVEKPYAPQEWLTYLIDVFLRPGARLRRDAEARRIGLSFNHVLDGMLIGERRETSELFALEVRANSVRRRVLLPGRAGVDSWGYRAPDEERLSRQERKLSRLRRFETAVAEDLARSAARQAERTAPALQPEPEHPDVPTKASRC
jgi:hypothetical protein